MGSSQTPPEPSGRREILDELLAELDRNGAIDANAARARHPGREATVDRLLLAIAEFQQLSRSNSAVLAVGSLIGDFRIEGQLGRGGMGMVYRATQGSLGQRPVALKVVSSADLDARGIARFQREALSAASVHHPHLAEVHGFGTDRGHLYYAMRLIEGPTLRAVLSDLANDRERGGHLPPARVIVRWMRGVADALAAVHAAGLVHRDVKPSNIMLQSNGPTFDELAAAPAVLVDFGLARRVDSRTLTAEGASGATLTYAPPEQLLGKDVDAQADVFALGVTMHDLLAARRPDQRPSAAAGLEHIASLCAGIDRDLAAIVTKCIESDEGLRYRDAGRLRDDLDAWLERRPVAARRIGPLERTRRAWKRRPVFGTALFLAAIASAILVWFAWRGVIEAVTDAQAAVEAHASGDLGRLRSALDSIPSAAAPFLLRDADLGARRREVLDPAQEAWLVVAEALDAGATQGALQRAARALQSSGFDREPLLARFLWSRVASPEWEADLSVEDSMRSEAIRLLARVMVESDPFPGDFEARQGYATPILDLLAEPAQASGLRPLDERFLMTALTGCASIEHMPRLVEEVLTLKNGSESQRQGLQCLYLILLQALANPAGVPTITTGLDESMLRSLQPVWQFSVSGSPGVNWRPALSEVLFTWNLLARASDPSGAPSRTPSAYLVGLEASDDGTGSIGLPALFLASRGDGRIARFLRSADAAGRDDASTVGEACGLLADPDVTEDCRSRYEHAEDPRLLSEFDAGWSIRTESPLSRLLQHVPDRTTWMEAPHQEEWAGHLDAAGRMPLDDDCLAVWEFNAGPPWIGGWASHADWFDAKWQPMNEGSCLLLQPKGSAMVELSFAVPAAPTATRADLVLMHQRNARWHLPHGGVVVVRLQVDDSMNGAEFRFEDAIARRDRFPIDLDWLSPGLHSIRVTIDSSATVPYRLYSAWLEAVPREDWSLEAKPWPAAVRAK